MVEMRKEKMQYTLDLGERYRRIKNDWGISIFIKAWSV